MTVKSKTKIPNENDRLPFVEITKRISDLCYALETDLNAVVTDQLKKNKGKFRSDKTKALVNEYKKQIVDIKENFKLHLESAPLELEKYINSINKRANDFNEMMFNIQTYSIKNIKKQLHQYAKREQIEAHLANEFINEIANAMKNLVIKYVITFDEFVLEKLCEKEVINLNMEYFIKNKALQIINPHKYAGYLKLVYIGIKAFYHDFKFFVNSESEYFRYIEKFFLKIISKMEALETQYDMTEGKYNEEALPLKTESFPTHIFKNKQAFDFFCTLATHAKNQEEIGFYFRQMSEKENPKQIVAKETVFRAWFNEESKQPLELKNPIKTLDRIKGISQKHAFYELTKLNSSAKNTQL